MSSESPIPNPGPRLATPLYACLYQPPAPGGGPDVGIDVPRATLEPIAREFSPRYERHHDHLVSIDVTGLERMLGRRTNTTGFTTEDTEDRRNSPVPSGLNLRVLRGQVDPARMIGDELRRAAVSRGVRVHVAGAEGLARG